MNKKRKEQVEKVIAELYQDSENSKRARRSERGDKPEDFKDLYLSISKEQGRELVEMIREKGLKELVEFGTSFGISTLFLALGALGTKGKIVTTELLESKANRAKESFERAGVSDLIEVRIGDALETLKGYEDPIDLLLLDGWKDLYLPLFDQLESSFHAETIIYVDNADMKGVKSFLEVIKEREDYQIELRHKGKAALLTRKAE